MSEATIAHLDYDLLDPGNRRDPYPLYAELRDAGPIHWSESLGGWVLSRYDEVHSALDHPELSAARFTPYLESLRRAPSVDRDSEMLYEGLNAWFTFADPPYHTRLRSITRRVLSRPMKAIGTRVEPLLDSLLAEADERGGADLLDELARPLSVGAIAELLDVPLADRALFLQWSELLTALIAGAVDVPSRRERALEGLRELNSYIHALVAERRGRGGEDVVAGLLSERHEGEPLSTDEVVATIAMLLFAGHGSTTNAIGNGALALLRNETQRRALIDGEVTAEDAFEELLRYDSPVQVTVRNAACDGALGCGEISAGDRVFLFVASANRDGRRVERPDELDLARSVRGRHITFGYGIHFCLGAPMARIVAPMALDRLFARARSVALAETELEWQATVGFRGLERLPVDVAA
jgi:cytochrome P450